MLLAGFEPTRNLSSGLCSSGNHYTTAPPNTYISNVEPSNSVFLKTCNTEFDGIIITWIKMIDLLEIEDKVNLALLINKKK